MPATSSAYDPFEPARRPGGKPDAAPAYRVLAHKRFRAAYDDLITRVGEQQAQQFWDHVASTPGSPCAVGSVTILKGKAGQPQMPGFSRTHHFELTGSARADYQYNDAYVGHQGDPHPVVVILTISFTSH
jgi:hypothetical protein